MHELTEPLQKALEKEEPLRVRHPRTNRIYVLVRADVFDRLAQHEDVAPGVLRSKKAFLRDLPTLLQNPKYDRWSVAYCGDDRIALSPSEVDVLRECQKRGLKSDQYYLGVIAAFDDDIDIDRSLREIE